MSKYYYEYQHDAKYCYAGSFVLKNKLNILEQDELNNAEREITSLEIAEAEVDFIKGNLDIQHLKDIHYKIFSEIYSWAGEFRDVDISKGTIFCKSQFIENEMVRIFKELRKEKYLIYTKRENISEKLSYYLGEINAIHPFREGNGRVQRLFIEYLGYVSGYEVDFSNISRKEMLKASEETFLGEYNTMINIFNKALSPVSYNDRMEIVNKMCNDREILKYVKEADVWEHT